MLTTIILAVTFVLGGLLFIILYYSGYLTVGSKSAVMFVGSLTGNDSCKARFTSCTGHMKRILHLKEHKTYHFVLNSSLDSGDLIIDILDSEKNSVISLSNKMNTADMLADGKRYYLQFTFCSTTGSYELIWN